MSVWEDVAMAQAIETMAQLSRSRRVMKSPEAGDKFFEIRPYPKQRRRFMRWSRDEQQMREWEKHCLCSHPFDPEDCTCDALDAYCSDCDQWDWCRCRAAEQRSDAFREEER